MTAYYTLEPLVVGVFPRFDLSRFLYGHEQGEKVRAPCLAWLARGNDGHVALVDTGPAAPTEVTAGLHTELIWRAEHRIDAALRKQGVEPAEVSTVLFTHLHFDHCAYGELLPNARFYAQRRELQYAVAPEERHRGGYEAGHRGALPGWMQVFDRLELIDGDKELSPGFNVLSIPGHTPGSAAALFATKKGKYAIAGDMVSRVENWQGSGGHIAPGIYFDLEDCQRSFLKLEREADAVLASHDFRMLDQSRYPK